MQVKVHVNIVSLVRKTFNNGNYMKNINISEKQLCMECDNKNDFLVCKRIKMITVNSASAHVFLSLVYLLAQTCTMKGFKVKLNSRTVIWMMIFYWELQ